LGGGSIAKILGRGVYAVLKGKSWTGEGEGDGVVQRIDALISLMIWVRCECDVICVWCMCERMREDEAEKGKNECGVSGLGVKNRGKFQSTV
jgi:organic radical activating enzyme